MTPRWLPILTTLLVVGLVVTSAGWSLSGRAGSGLPIECYSIECYSIDSDAIAFSPVHGAATTKATFTVEESDEMVVLGYFEDVSSGLAPAMAYAADVSYTLTRPLGNRPVVDPSGQPIKNCDELSQP